MSNSSGVPDLSSALASVWERFRGTMDARVAAVGRAAAAAESGTLDAEVRRHAEREAHKLAGAVGTFGFHRASTLAREAEDILAGDDAVPPSAVRRLQEITAALTVDLAKPVAGPVAPDPQPRPQPHASDLPVLLVVDRDHDLAKRIAVEAGPRGLRVVHAATVSDAASALNAERPDGALVELDLGEEDGGQVLELLAASEPPIPAVVLTSRLSFEDRLAVARRGGRVFLSKPSAPAAAIDAVVELMERGETLQGTVLAVDDDPAVLRTIESLLLPHGIRVEPLADPTEFWDALDAAQPDAVVLDLDMPGVSGLELCRVLRGAPRWRGTPVLFLSARRNQESIASMFAAGADDYVPKPILGPELVNRLMNRLERVQLQRHLAETDPLTGLANRRRGAEQLGQLISLAGRQQKPFTLALIDLDHFKVVNDRYGHASGDEVLERIAGLLRRHFRSEDVVARWGGEEFVVGMFAMDTDNARRRLVQLQERLGAERFAAGGEAFAVTLSAGVAETGPAAGSLDLLLRVADQALYRAKAAGRNCVEAAG